MVHRAAEGLARELRRRCCSSAPFAASMCEGFTFWSHMQGGWNMGGFKDAPSGPHGLGKLRRPLQHTLVLGWDASRDGHRPTDHRRKGIVHRTKACPRLTSHRKKKKQKKTGRANLLNFSRHPSIVREGNDITCLSKDLAANPGIVNLSALDIGVR